MTGRRTERELFLAEGAAVETADGTILTVKGLVHPPGSVVAYPRYVPDEAGERVREGRRYRRLSGLAEQEDALRGAGWDLASSGPASDLPGPAVPLAAVVRGYDPRARLRALRRDGASDPLEQEALTLTGVLAAEARVPWSALGVTGSLLLGLHAPGSDVDVAVYGDAACRRVHAALGRLFAQAGSGLTWPDDAGLAAIHHAHRVDSPLTAAEFSRHQARKVNEGSHAGRPFFVRFVKLPGEVGERYDEPRHVPVGETLVEAVVTGARDALFTPCRYEVAQVVWLEGERVDGLDEIVSYRGRFADQARAGERVRARGILERVVGSRGAERARVVVGRPGEFLVRVGGREDLGHMR